MCPHTPVRTSYVDGALAALAALPSEQCSVGSDERAEERYRRRLHAWMNFIVAAGADALGVHREGNRLFSPIQ